MDKHTTFGGCIEWDGYIDEDGYGKVSVNGKWKSAHRNEWEKKNGLIPDGLVIDHLCRNRKCINVEHMELVTIKENVLRGEGPTAVNARATHCKYGHPLEYASETKRFCRECAKRRWREYRRRKMEEGTWKRT